MYSTEFLARCASNGATTRHKESEYKCTKHVLKLSHPPSHPPSNKQTLTKQTLNPLTVESLDQVFEGDDLGLHTGLSQCVVVLYAFQQMLQAPETVGLDGL